MSQRLVWHDSGWDGRVCGSPGWNVECQSNPRLAKTFDLSIEEQLAGKPWKPVAYHSLQGRRELIAPTTPTKRSHHGRPVNARQYRIPCWECINTFGEGSFDYRPPTHGNRYETANPEKYWLVDRNKPRIKFKAQDWKELFPRSFIATPFQYLLEGMKQEVPRDRQWVDAPKEETALLADFWSTIDPGRSLVLFYCRGQHPWDEICPVLPVGVSLVDWVGRQRFHGRGATPQASYPVWQRHVCHGWPREGFRIPWHLLSPDVAARVAKELDIKPIAHLLPRYGTDAVHTTQVLPFVERLLGVSHNLTGNEVVRAAGSPSWLKTVRDLLLLAREVRPTLAHLFRELGLSNAPYLAAELEAASADVHCDPIEFVLGERPIPDTLIHRTPVLKRAREALLSMSMRTRKWKLLLTQMDVPLPQFRSLSALEGSSELPLTRAVSDPYVLVERGVLPKDHDEPDEAEPLAFPVVDDAVKDRPRTGKWVVSATPDDCRRWRSKLHSELRTCARRPGSTVVPIASLPPDLAAWIGAPSKPVNETGPLVKRFMLAGEDVVALATLHAAEQEIAKALCGLQRLSKSKSEGVCKWTQSGVLVLHGSAGTGKTEVINRLLQADRIRSAWGEVLLLTPTGRASTILHERLGPEARPETIHKFLQRNGWAENGRPLKGKGRVQANTVILDESSMVDSETLAWLLRALDKRKLRRFVFVGDPSQLPPVGAGRPFADVIQWLRLTAPERLFELKVPHRNRGVSTQRLQSALMGKRSTVKQLVEAVEQGDEEVEIAFWRSGAELKQKLAELCIGHEVSAKALGDFHVVSVTNGKIGGVEFLNHCLWLIMGSRSKRYTSQVSNGTAGVSDKVVQTRNAWIWSARDKEKGCSRPISNGAIGIVERITKGRTKVGKGPRVRVRFPTLGNLVYSYSISQAKTQLALGYATTVHKAQGSGFQHVVAVIPWEKRALSRELLYTAFTRHRNKLTILFQQPIHTRGDEMLFGRRIVPTLYKRSTMLGELLQA